MVLDGREHSVGYFYLLRGIFKVKKKKSEIMTKEYSNRPVAMATAPINTEGMAMMTQPKAATNDSNCAREADLLDNTRWK